MQKILWFLLIIAAAVGHLCYALETAQITVSGLAQEIQYSVNKDLHIKPVDAVYYNKITGELNALTCRFGTKDPITLTGNDTALTIAPTLHTLLSKKVSTIAKRMGLDISTLHICIQPMNYSAQSMYNAHAQTSVQVSLIQTKLVRSDGVVLESKIDQEIDFSHNLTLNAESLSLLLWHEGFSSLPESEGLLDGVIAHELAHIFHKHLEHGIPCELEADATGAKNLLNRNNLIDAVDVLYYAGTIYAYLQSNKQIMRLTDAEMVHIVGMVSSSLLKTPTKLGYFSQCSTHTAFSHKVQVAITKAIQRIKNKNMFSNVTMIASLLYDELYDASQTPLPEEGTDMAVQYQIGDDTLTLYSQLTHPDPKSRRDHIMTQKSYKV